MMLRLSPALLLPLFFAACSGETPDLVVYCALDQDLSEPLIQDFEQRTGLHVQTQFDVERNKTVGLVSRILHEAEGNPHADVFWNNEIAHTLRLQQAGLTLPYRSPSAEGIPDQFRDADGHWTGFAARARVILYRTDADLPVPSKLDDFLDPKYAMHGAMAVPLTGTTLTNATVMAELRGRQAMLDWFTAVEAAGLHFGSGNADVMRRTQSGDFHWCFTDTDDAAKAIDSGYPVAVRYLEQGDGDTGVLLIPNTLCILDSGKNLDAAKKFADFILSFETEARLAHSISRQIPLHEGALIPDGVGHPGKDFKTMQVDWEKVAAAIGDLAKDLQEAFVR
ncbi:MAG: extracellular solute-binding protein [Planctomycetota bacterium]